MKRLLVIVVGVLLLSCTTDAQGSGSAVGSGSGVIITTPCLDAGFTSCCPGRDDACHPGDNRTRASCYCDAFCLQTASDDCCDDLTMGLLLCNATSPTCAPTLEERVKELAIIQRVVTKYLGIEPPEKFTNLTMYLEELRQKVTNSFFNPLDLDSNNMLDGHEFHLFFLDLLSDVNAHEMSEICELDYLTFCDGDGDDNVDRDELERCTGTLPYCNTPDDTAKLLARDLLVTALGPVFDVAYGRTLFLTTIFGLADIEEPKQLLSMNEFPTLYELIIRRYSLLPSVCPESVFEVCNSDGDQFLSEEEMIACGSTQS